MKAAVYYENGGPEVFRYEDVPDPACHPKGVVIRVEAVSIEGGDLLHRVGAPLRTRPHVVGYQAAGTIVEVGAQVTGFAVGDRVVTTGADGSHAAMRATAASATWKVPDGLDIRLASCVPIPFGTADDCLFEFGRLRAGETVLIQGGGGGVGLAAIQLAKRAGATVYATASSDEKLAKLREYGMDVGINYRRDDAVAEIRRLTDNKGVNLVVDPVGGDTLAQSLKCIGYRGRAITVGNASRDVRQYDIRTLGGMNQSITGVFLGAEISTPRARAMIDGHLRDVAKGELKVLVDREFALADAAEAHRYIESRSAVGRVLLIP